MSCRTARLAVPSATMRCSALRMLTEAHTTAPAHTSVVISRTTPIRTSESRYCLRIELRSRRSSQPSPLIARPSGVQWSPAVSGQQRVHTGRELSGAERLGEVLVGARLEAGVDVVLLG